MPDYVILGVVVVIALAIWKGPKMLPEWGAAIGKTVRQARSNATKDDDEETPAQLGEGSLDSKPVTTARADTTNAPRS